MARQRLQRGTALAAALVSGVIAADMAYARPVAAASGFDAAYQRAGRPRVVVFWNRELSEEVGTAYSDVLRGHSEERAGVDQDGAYRSSDVTITAGTERNDVQRRPSEFSERTDWKFEAGFVSGLAQAGINMVDRTMIVRRSGKGVKGNTPNQQAIEMDALQGYADVLVEVLQTADDDAPSGVSFKVTAKRISNGRILAQFVTGAQPIMNQPRTWVAGPNGYERARPVPPSMSQISRQLVAETLDALGAGLAR